MAPSDLSPIQSGKRFVRNTLTHLTDRRDRIHFLHVRKAAGSQIKTLAAKLNKESSTQRIVVHPHNVGLRNIPEGDRYFFSVRDPASRFRSGFYSRKRCGQPRNYNPWSPDEAEAFGEFEHANDLAEALFEDGARGLQAAKAVLSIRHTAVPLTDWMQYHGFFADVRKPVWIIRQENFAEDMAHLLDRLGLDSDFLGTKTKSERAHANDYSGIPDLSEKAHANLKRWYAADYELLRMCDSWLDAQLRKQD